MKDKLGVALDDIIFIFIYIFLAICQKGVFNFKLVLALKRL